MAQYPKLESISSIGSIILAILEVQARAVATRPGGFRYRVIYVPAGVQEEPESRCC